MTRIIGKLEGINGLLNGRLYIRTSSPFIGGPDKELTFRVKEGEVDIELPPTPGSVIYEVDWRDTGDMRKLSFPERWKVPQAEEVSLDELRSHRKQVQTRSDGGKANLVEIETLKNEGEQLRIALSEAEESRQSLMRRLSTMEAQTAALTGQLASIKGELQNVKRPAAPLPPITQVVERLVEVNGDEWKIRLAEERQQRILAEETASSLKQQLDDRLSLVLHFGSLHNEIDRLKVENQQLHSRIDGLKNPVRSSSVFRTEAIAELDRLAGGN
jgi:chromosome segregation ATPase